MTRIYLNGNAYPVKEDLKKLGCRFDGEVKKWWTENPETAEKAQILINGDVIYNSPPPQNLKSQSPIEFAEQHQRIIVQGAEIQHFQDSVYNKNEVIEDGIVIIHKDKKYLRLAHSRPQYYNQDMLDDFDWFHMTPGWYFQWDGIEVLPNEKEIKEEEEKRQVELEKEQLRLAVENEQKLLLEKWGKIKESLIETTCNPKKYQKTGERLQINCETVAEKLILEDEQIGWSLYWYTYDDSRYYYYLPADIAEKAKIDQAFDLGVTPEYSHQYLEKYSGCYGADLHRAVANASEQIQEELRQNAIQKEKQKQAEKDRQTRLFKANQLANSTVKELAKGASVSLGGYDGGPLPKNVKIKFTSKSVATNFPETISIIDPDGQFSFDLIVIKELPPSKVLVWVSLGKAGYQMLRLDIDAQIFVESWPLDVKPESEEKIYRPSNLDGDMNIAYKAARKKTGTGFIKPETLQGN